MLFATSCGSWSGEIDSADEAVEVANGFMAENLPQVDLSEMVIETRDLGDRWQVAYDMPGGSTGGPAIFVIEKRSGEIAHVEIGQ